jgi:hypothetical protein
VGHCGADELVAEIEARLADAAAIKSWWASWK